MVQFEPNFPPPKSDINLYFDIISPYSYFAFAVARHYAPIWRSQGYAVHYVPVFQAGLMQGSGNAPPMAVPAKARASDADSARWARLLDLRLERPPTFPVNSIHCARLLAVVGRYHNAKMAPAMAALWEGFWGGGGLDIASPDDLTVMLSRVFTGAEVDIMLRMSRAEHFKYVVRENTKRALRDGCFGCPWIEVVRGESGEASHYFGNDRWAMLAHEQGLRWDGYAVVGGGEKAVL